MALSEEEKAAGRGKLFTANQLAWRKKRRDREKERLKREKLKKRAALRKSKKRKHKEKDKRKRRQKDNDSTFSNEGKVEKLENIKDIPQKTNIDESASFASQFYASQF